MRATRRRLVLQTTSLLDLLLIVIFAQYVDLQDVVRRDRRAADRAVAEARRDESRARQAAAKARRDATALQHQLAEANRDGQTLALEAARLQHELAAARSEMEAVARQIDQETQCLTQLISELLESTPDRGQQWRESARALTKLLLQAQELRKRADVWEVRLGPRPLHQVAIFCNGAELSRYPFAADATSAQRRIVELVRSSPEVKRLVLFFFVADPRAARVVAKRIEDGLNDACRELAGYYRDKRFEVAVRLERYDHGAIEGEEEP